MLGLQRPAHIIDVTSIQGLLDMISLGNIIEFANALDHRTYEGPELTPDEDQERLTAISRYHTFIVWYSNNFGLLIQDQWVNPGYLFKKRLVDFAVTVFEYFRRQQPLLNINHRTSGLTDTSLWKCLRHHIAENWLSLVPYLDATVEQPSLFLYYTGPDVVVMAKTAEHVMALTSLGLAEVLEYDDAPITFSTELASQKRPRPIPESPPSPSSSRVLKCKK
jgi:hypothetical protein